MIKWINKFGGLVLVGVCILSTILNVALKIDFASLSNLPLDNEYRLKFVDSIEYEMGLSSIIKLIYPVEVLSYSEKEGKIEIKTYENSIIYAPTKCKVENKTKNVIKLKSGNLSCVIYNIISGVSVGEDIQCGDVVGSIIGDSFCIDVFIGDNQLSLSELEAIIWKKS